MFYTHSVAFVVTSKLWWILLCCLPGTVLAAPACPIQALVLNFYDQDITLYYQEEMLFQQPVRVEELVLRRAFDQLENRPYQTFLTTLQTQAAEWGLNDFLYGQLIQQSLQRLYGPGVNDAAVELTTYFLLAKSGFDVRLTYRSKLVQVNVYTNDVLYEIPLIQENQRQYANLTKKEKGTPLNSSMYLLDHRPNPTGKPFSFKFRQWPRLCAEAQQRVVSFTYGGENLEVAVTYHSGIARLLQDYPLVDEYWYLDAPLSNGLLQSLVPELKELLAGRSQEEALALLVAFTRSAFNYKDDKQVFGSNKPMVADELFCYPFSDCEDRCALFYALAKVLLDLPMIVLAYDDHLSVAVAVKGSAGETVLFQGERYTFCDPTGPKFSSEIGQIPQGYEGKSFEIIGHYPGQVKP
jgi:hypothetical protein